MAIIIESQLEAATNVDILADTRLQTVPGPGRLIFEMQAADASAANNYTVTIALPGGAIPAQNILVPANSVAGVPGVLDSQQALILTFPVQQGGHCVFSCIETGDTELMWRVSFIG